MATDHKGDWQAQMSFENLQNFNPALLELSTKMFPVNVGNNHFLLLKNTRLTRVTVMKVLASKANNLQNSSQNLDLLQQQIIAIAQKF